MAIEVSSKQYFRSLTIIHAALIAGQLLFLAVSLSLTFSGKQSQDDSSFKLLAPTLVAGCIIIGSLIKKKMLSNLEEKELKEKLKLYQSAIIVQCALIEGASMFSIVCLLLTGKIYFVAIVLLCIAIQINERPGKSRAISQLNLTDEEIALVNDPDALVAETNARERY